MHTDSLILEMRDDVKQNENNYSTKIQLIKDNLNDIKERKKHHGALHRKYRKINTIVKGFVNTLNAVSVRGCSLTT